MRTTSKARQSALFLFFVAALLVDGAAQVRAQSALDGFDPNANGTIRVVTVQPDGKILIGGDFTTLSPSGGAAVTRNHIARLNADGTLDTLFNPNANLTVWAIAVQADGKILAGGDFVDFGDGTPTIGGQIRNFIARLDPTTGLADSWNPNANGRVRSIVVQADGKILAGGDFGFGTPTIGGQSRNFIARLDATTGLADSFNPNANSNVRAIAVQADGKILVVGVFTGIGGAGRNRVARLDPTTGAADMFDPNSNNIVNAVAVQADGKIVVGGTFFGANSIGGLARNRIARLDPTTGAADSWDPNANSDVNAVAVQADGKILIGGTFNGAGSIGGTTIRNRIARLDATTGTPDLFDPNANNNINAVAVQADGKVLTGGLFTTLTPNGGAAVTRNHIVRLEADGSLDQTFPDSIALTPSGSVNTTAVQPDGRILVGGNFFTAGGMSRHFIARFNSDGTLDPEFDPNPDVGMKAIAVQADGRILLGDSFRFLRPNGAATATARNRIARVFADGTLDGTTNTGFNPTANGDVLTIAVQGDGRILIGGLFTTLQPNGDPNPTTRMHIARLNADGTLDTSFNPNANDDVNSIAVQADGKILVGGTFTNIGGATRNRIARLEPVLGTADSWDPNADGDVYSIALQSDGKILAGGNFGNIGAGTRNRIARLDATNGSADSFNPNASDAVESIAVQADGQILAGGLFTTIGGAGRNRIARLNATNGIADSFDPNASNEVRSVTLQADGKILVGGSFFGASSIAGQSRNYFVRLSNATGALQNLAVTQTTVTWTRGGSSPQFARVTFESSTDNVNYSALGNGTAAASSNWTLTGLSLLTGQNIYIRARGYYRSGYLNGSESITESVRNAFITGPTPISISGTVSYCADSNPVPNVTLTLTGSASSSTLSNGSGNYTFTGLASGGSYTVTPTKSTLPPGSSSIDTVDVVATQRHLLGLGTPLSGCRLAAADVNGDTVVNTVDLVAIQRFLLGLSTGIANVGKYQFTPVNRTYSGVVGDQTAQSYSTLILGDVAPGFVHRESVISNQPAAP